ncbi:MAG TPA: O-antigen translocase [Rudaea sp.]|nr:O-antigen translocase [Rudaea sp.]
MSETDSYRQTLRSTSIIGGASIARVLIGLLRTKIAAVLLGPSGVGLIGILQSLLETASTVAALGSGTMGTRQISEASGRSDPMVLAAARRALLLGTLGLALVGAAAFFLLRNTFAVHIFRDAALSVPIGWLAIGVAMMVVSSAQTAVLTGMRRIGDVARLNVLSMALSTVLGISALLLWDANGIVAFVISLPLSALLLGFFYVMRLQREAAPPIPHSLLITQWRMLMRSGAAFMIASMAVPLGQLVVRTYVKDSLGTDALGQFQAAWLISMTYIGFVLTAMGTDYYPRLTAAMHDHVIVNRMVNAQSEIALMLSAPVFFIATGFAPWIIEALYTSDFAGATSVLRWQILGDVLKVASWPLGFIILAAGDAMTFMLCESAFVIVYVALTRFMLPESGIVATGIAFFLMYGLYLPVVYWLARRRTEFQWHDKVVWLLFPVLIATAGIALLSEWSERMSALAGTIAALVSFIYAADRLETTANLALLPKPLLAILRGLASTWKKK